MPKENDKQGGMPELNVRVPIPMNARGWWALATMVERNGRLVVAELRITPVDPRWQRMPSNGLTSDDIRSVQLSKAVERAWGLPGTFFTFTPLFWEMITEGPPLRPGQHRTDKHHAEVAQRYLNAYRLDPRRVLQVMLEQYEQEGKHYTIAQVRSWVRRARERGFLTPSPSQGKPGGEATPELLEFLEQQGGSVPAEQQKRKRRGGGTRSKAQG